MTSRVLPIRRLFKIVNGGTPTPDAENWGGSIPWATPADFGETFSSIGTTRRTLTQRGVDTGSTVAPKGAILLSTRAPIGYVAINETAMAFNQGCRALVPRDDADSRFFGYQLESIREILQAQGLGTTFLELSSDALAQVSVLAPSPEEQHRIADFLDREVARIDRLLTLKYSVQTHLAERVRSVRDSLVNQLASSQESAPLRRFITRIEQGASPQCEAGPREGEKERAVLKLSAVKNGKFHPGENKRLPEDSRPSSLREVHAGDFLVTRANTPSLVGDVAVVGDNPPPRLLLPDLIYRVGLTSEIKAEYVMQIALSGRIRSLIESTARGTSQSMVKLRGEDIKGWPIPIITRSQQTEITKEITAAAEKAASLQDLTEQQVKLLAERRQALITAAVTGQIDVSTASGRGIEE
ncbi:restriction endonuclease subunit S [Streptomyces sp. NPDC055037]|uniref:restriction endonuclease subunit S n=1 Tax=Streptomyces sp. 029-5 TaxID=2789261 RepID=UPI00397EF399